MKKIKHEKNAVQDVSKPNCNDWNNTHVDEDGNEIQLTPFGEGLVLIDTKTANSNTNISFEDLDGDSDKIYKLVADIILENGDRADFLNLLINDVGVSNAFSNSGLVNAFSENLIPINELGNIRLFWNCWSSPLPKLHIEAYLFAETGLPRRLKVETDGLADWRGTHDYSIPACYKGTSFWEDIITNITKIGVDFGNHTFSGDISLYKIV